MSKFLITKSPANGQFYFKLKAGNGEVILTSEGYVAHGGATNGIASVKENAVIDSHFEQKEAKNGEFYFVLKARNGQVIGVSEMYKTKAGCDNGIASVQENAPKATIDDESVVSQ
jgi:uncharacterized protein